MTDAELAELLEHLEALTTDADEAAARTSLLDFTRYTKPDYRANWHHKVICAALERVVNGSCKRLMLFMPPRYGKSELMSRRLPAYALGINPDLRIISTSYSADLASMMNRDVQRIIESPDYARLFPETQLWGKNIRTVRDGSYLRNNDIFEIVGHSGYYRSAGVGGGITGMGFDIGIIDDPFKNRKEANSPTTRKAVWEWYTSTFYTRQQDDAAIILCMTRWHGDDLAGRLIKAMTEPTEDEEDYAEQWDVISFPAIATEERHPYDPREVGEPLWEAKHDLHKLRVINKAQGEYDFSALYQQSPTPDSGGLFKRDKLKRIAREPADIVRRVRFWDLATSEKTSADYTVGVLMGLTKAGDTVVLDVRRFQMDWDSLPERIEAVALSDGQTVAIGVEKVFFQSRIIKSLLKRPALHRFNLRGFKPDGDKFTRALPFAARAGEDMVYVLDRAWTEDYVTELCAFPLGTHDDQVDATSGAYLMLDKGAPQEAHSWQG